MPTITTSGSKIEEFLARYRSFRARQIPQQAQELAGKFDRILPGLEAAKRRRTEHARLVAPDFNVFSILRLKNQEVAHSNFLGELLDPRGMHGQGTLFFDSFLATCGQKRGDSIPLSLKVTEPWAPAIWVSRESTIFEGRCDLLIHAPGLCLLIENKVHAPESDKQLIRYRDWLASKERAKNKLLVFLTRDGRRSTDTDIRDEEYIRLSYMDDIRKWLNECMDRIQAPDVRSVVGQYLTVLDEWKERQDA
jgi:hypothetical protein